MKNRKTTIRKFILTAAMLAALYSNAKEGFTSYASNDLNRTTLTINDAKEGNQLVIKDLNGIILYKELIKNSGVYTRGFDLTSLPDGAYVFELDKDMEIKSIPFQVLSNKVTFNKEKEITYFKPLVRIKKNNIYLTQLTLQEEPLKVSIYYYGNDGFSELIFSETIQDIKIIERIYKLDETVNGKYKMVLNTPNRTFFEYFTL
ncbi:hypothetical protein [Yeosuana sp.]|uniref:hypothetical protein n=1 Tax=Yeosuana sp. TaxID=2529388 RepID=UPI004054BA47